MIKITNQQLFSTIYINNTMIVNEIVYIHDNMYHHRLKRTLFVCHNFISYLFNYYDFGIVSTV